MSIDVTVNTNLITVTPSLVQVATTPQVSTIDATGTGSSITATPTTSIVDITPTQNTIKVSTGARLSELQDVDITGIIDKSVLSFDQSTSKFVPTNSSSTISVLTDGGNF